MQTVLIELLNEKALKLLKELEELRLIKVIANKRKSTQSLSDRFAGKLSDTAAESLHQHIKKSREEWERDI